MGISGSLRDGSYNRALLRTAERLLGRDIQLEIQDLSAIPLYDATLDGEVKPEPVQALLRAIAASQALLFATPEYNYSIPGLLKNALDWASRPAYQSVLAHKPAGILSASMSPVGGARAQMHLRDVLTATLTPVYPSPDFLLPLAQNAFDDQGMLHDPVVLGRLERYLQGYIAWVIGHGL